MDGENNQLDGVTKSGDTNLSGDTVSVEKQRPKDDVSRDAKSPDISPDEEDALLNENGNGPTNPDQETETMESCHSDSSSLKLDNHIETNIDASTAETLNTIEESLDDVTKDSQNKEINNDKETSEPHLLEETEDEKATSLGNTSQTIENNAENTALSEANDNIDQLSGTAEDESLENRNEKVNDSEDIATSKTADETSKTADETSKTADETSRPEQPSESSITNESDGTNMLEKEGPHDEKQDLEKDVLDANASKDKTDDDDPHPQFENAPEHKPDESTEDHTKASDPFDELLKGDDGSPNKNDKADLEKQSSIASMNIDDDDDDHLGGDDAEDNPVDDSTDQPGDDTQNDEEPPEEVADAEQPGTDDDVCLLPDTEREISEEDKLKAMEARKLAEAAVSKEEPQEVAEPEAESNTEAPVTEPAEEPTTEENTSAENEKEKEPEQESQEPDAAATVETLSPNIIQEISPVDNPCLHCSEDKPCTYKLLKNDTLKYICSEECAKKFQESNTTYKIEYKKYLIIEIEPSLMNCSECEEDKMCYFYYNSDGVDTNYCSLQCLHSMMGDERHKYMFKKRKLTITEVITKKAFCSMCSPEVEKDCMFEYELYGDRKYLCSMDCVKTLNDVDGGRYKVIRKKIATIATLKQPLLKLKVISNATDKYLDEGYKIQAKTPAAAQAAREDRERSFIRKCKQCSTTISGNESNLSWETMDFCNKTCLGRYQNVIGSKCANCKNAVNHTSLGKYCVRFGYDIRQFCCSSCLEEFKKGLKICCYCQRDMSNVEGFLAPVGDKGQFKDFCSAQCMEKFEQMSKNPVPQPIWAKCAVCAQDKATTIEVAVTETRSQRLCSDPCFAAFKFVNSVFPDQCRWCKKYFERKSAKSFTIYEDSAHSAYCFCTKQCMNVYISNTRHIVPCNWCKVKKYNFDMIKQQLTNGQSIMMCSLNCLNLYQVSVNAVSSRRIKCDHCKRTSQAQYHLTMSDATVRNFCTYQCVMSFQGQYAKHGPPLVPGTEAIDQAAKAVPAGVPRRTYSATTHKNNAATKAQARSGSEQLPVISNVQSLASPPPLTQMTQMLTTRSKSKRGLAQLKPKPPEPEPPKVVEPPPPPPKPATPPPPPPPKIYNHVLVKTLPPPQVANKATMTKPIMTTKGVSCRPHPCTKECQTDSSLERRVLIPVPVPIYVPVPCAMYSLPFPIPVPIPLPIPTPVFIPTTRNSSKGIMKEISKIHDKMPTDPFEAELLMMAEMVAGDKKKSESDSETDDEPDAPEFNPTDAMDGNNAFGEDMLQMALKMATEYEEPAVDLESAMTANTITPSSHPGMPGLEGEGMHHHQLMVAEQQRAVAALRASQAAAAGRKRAPPPPQPRARSKRGRRQEPAPPPPEPAREPQEKPDANMCLKYTFGVNAWKQWVMTKNAEIEKSSIRRKPFKSEILQLTADELNYSLCLFVKEVRKPNQSEYAPDTIYYLVLGIQQFLFENGRIDNIFTDPYYEKFTDCLDEVARKFSVLYNDSQYIVTRVEEEHLWECKQLGAHSPHVLLSTLMFFNTKHFNLVTVEEHMQLSFSHIMKHWKRNPNQPGAAKMPGSRNVLLRFYPPQSALEANSRKKKVYEQQENEENPLRCPVKLYEFYISKCPESVRTRNDVFYLQPERSCVPDSPVWYSTQPLSRDALAKMLHRVKMVKEINIALLTS